MRVAISTEGAAADAFNGYDRGVYSISYIQLLGSNGTAGRLLAFLAERDPHATSAELARWLQGRGVRLEKNGQMVKTGVLAGEAMALALYGCNGTIGSWRPENKALAEQFALKVISRTREGRAPELALQFVKENLFGFVMPRTLQALYGGGQDLVGSGWRGALQALFLSFSANLPEVADQRLWAYVAKCQEQGLSTDFDDPGFVRGAARELTFGPLIAIYPERYDKIRPEVERLYGVDLPDSAALLDSYTRAERPTLKYVGVREIQQMLLRLGYNLGPGGADGSYGSKTREAVILFQARRGLVADGKAGAKTVAALAKACEGAK